MENVVAPALGTKRARLKEIKEAILNREIMPSMRALMTAGPALDRDHVAGYNCAYVAVDDRRVFDEIMYILMCGTGVGFSVERHHIDKLPTIADEFFDDGTTTLHIADSRIGWATAYRKLLSLLYDGLVPTLDYSKVRMAGTRLKTFGGRASGSDPLKNLCEYTIALFKSAKGRKLNELEVHDLVCKIAEVIVAGGVRRSALISLSNLTSERLRSAKSGAWYNTDPHRSLANNSVVYTERPDIGMFLKEWQSLIESRSGERGIFSRYACESSLPERREGGFEWGTNPCSEIVLRSRQFCNLTEVVARPGDSEEDLARKVELATILGTIQSTYTDFRYLGKRWKDNCEEERLLGVSLTGIMDCPLLSEMRSKTLPNRLERLKDVAIETNRTWAKKLGIPTSAAITCVKPSGTVSQLVGCSSGIHPRYSHYYWRRVRNDIKDPICQVLIDQGVPYELDDTNPNQYVFSFPIKAPEESVLVGDQDAIAQLELWKIYNMHWCEHKPSVSIYVSDDEWLTVGAWVYDNFDIMSGVSFFPRDNHIYKQAPYEEILLDEYNANIRTFPESLSLDFAEDTDSTIASQELACQGGQCEL
jgi:ribonucleoside-diphosphate reductase alpha chain